MGKKERRSALLESVGSVACGVEDTREGFVCVFDYGAGPHETGAVPGVRKVEFEDALEVDLVSEIDERDVKLGFSFFSPVDCEVEPYEETRPPEPAESGLILGTLEAGYAVTCKRGGG
jgi:hypothetical protein